MIERRKRQYPWTSELDLLLEQGYRAGLVGQRAAIDRIQKRTGWPRQACWDRARKLGLAQKRSISPRQWTPIDERRLINLAGIKNVRFIAQRLDRSVAAIRKRLRRLGQTSTRVREGLTKNQLAELIGSSPKTIQRWIDLGWLHGGYEGKNRDDDSIRISDKQFFEFWRNHPAEVRVHRWNREALEWLILLLGEMADWKTLKGNGHRTPREKPLHTEAESDRTPRENLTVPEGKSAVLRAKGQYLKGNSTVLQGKEYRT